MLIRNAATFSSRVVLQLKMASFSQARRLASSFELRDTDPAEDQEIGQVPDLGVDETRQAIDAAAKAFKTWGKTTARERYDFMTKLYHLMSENNDDLAQICTRENGKPMADSIGEIKYSASFIEWFAGEAIRDTGDVIPHPMKNIRSVVIKQPIGVCGIITPWNFPSAMAGRKLGAALAAGCTVVMKAPAETPFSMLAMAELCERAGIPPGVVNVVTTSKHTKEVGKELCENKSVKKVTFTGSTGVGKILMSQSAASLKKLSLELGGNAPFIVFEDADIDAAIEGAIACKFRSSGQTCVCANRLFVHSSIYDEFASRLAQKVDSFKVGNGFEKGITHGPLIHSKAVDKTHIHVEDAKAKGAKVLLGGRKLPDLGRNFYEPTILTDVQICAIDDEETFGPVAALYRFESESEVIQRSNDTDVGLSGYFFSRDIGRIWRVAEALEVGMVGINTGLISEASIPFGGVKESGFGREGSKYGLGDYQVIKYLAMGGLDR
ncbi:MAG: succinate semialdehyde dehydrogenase NADP+ linked [Cyphobasidiales sp. Tagirdzhanova-0007]|nr:MAG: succinate semialdehyde dehydrogenase NADP+ linked [Cyphobasidiales sp. Tagirdzhanova-0007]